MSKRTRHNRIHGAYTESTIVSTFLNTLNMIKLFHWKTMQYSAHKATDELYQDLGSKIDTFVEQLMGLLNTRIDVNPKTIMAINCDNLETLCVRLKKFRLYLENMPVSRYMRSTNRSTRSRGSTSAHQYDLLAVRDEMIGTINKFLYLSTLR